MKIVLTHKDLNRDGLGGGISRLYFELGKQLKKLGCKVTFVTSNPSFRIPWAKVIHIPYTEGGYRKYGQLLAEFLNSYSFDIIECSVWRAEGLEYATKKDRRPVVVRGDLCSLQFGDLVEAKDEIRLMQLSNANLAVSNAVKNYLERNYKISILQVIHNGANSPAKTYKKREHKRILWIGRPTFMKGFDRLKKIITLMPNYHFDVVLGRDLKKQHLKISSFKNIHYYRDLDLSSLEALFKKNSYLLSTSRFEGFGLAILEGMKQGLVPIIPAGSGGPEEFVKANKNGIIYKTEGKISQILKKHGEQNYQLISKNAVNSTKDFTWEKCARETLAVYKKLVNSRV